MQVSNFLTNKEIPHKLYHFLDLFLSSPSLGVLSLFDFHPLSLGLCLWLLAKVFCFFPPPFETGAFIMHR